MQFLRLLLLLCVASSSSVVLAQEASEAEALLEQMQWVDGPATVDITRRAEITLPQGYTYLTPGDTQVLMELMENPTSTDEYFVSPDDMRWFSVFSYEDTGHIEDEEDLNASALLESIREGTEYANKERRSRGWAELNIVGWKYRPFYESGSNRLAWAVMAESEGSQIVNYNTRVLGRTGVMSATLVAEPEILDAAVKEFQSVLSGFNYKSGDRYADYKPGDKLAAYGLAALVTGGAAAAVASSGAGKAFFKGIAVALAALAAAVASFFKRLFRRKNA